MNLANLKKCIGVKTQFRLAYYFRNVLNQF